MVEEKLVREKGGGVKTAIGNQLRNLVKCGHTLGRCLWMAQNCYNESHMQKSFRDVQKMCLLALILSHDRLLRLANKTKRFIKEILENL